MYLKYLQSIHLEFDAKGALKKIDFIRFLSESFKPLIKANIEQKRRELGT